MPKPPDDPDPWARDASKETVVVTATIRAADAARLDLAAERRGVGREEVLAQALDAFLAREMWSGGFIAPPPPMEIPPPFPWRPGSFKLRHRG